MDEFNKFTMKIQNNDKEIKSECTNSPKFGSLFKSIKAFKPMTNLKPLDQMK